MTERFEYKGVSLSEEQVRDVLEFWERRCLGVVPGCLQGFTGRETRYDIRRWVKAEDGSALRHMLTSEIIEDMRDWLEPWQEVGSLSELNGGEVLAWGSNRIRMVVGIEQDDALWGILDNGELRRLTDNMELFIRRPRPKTPTLGEMREGALVKRHMNEKPRRVLNAGTAGGIGVLRESDWTLDWWPPDTPVIEAKEPSDG